MYGKLINNNLIIAPSNLQNGEYIIYNPPADMYLSYGWKPVTFIDQPEAPKNYYYECAWEEQTNAIVQTWALMPLPDDIDESEAYGIIFGGIE